MKGWKKIFHASGIQKKVGVAILLSDKVDFKMVMRNKKWHYIMKKGSLHQEDKTITNTNAPNMEEPKYIKQRLIYLKEK